ncbi:hypothetical protein F3Y22_tig00110678pilonHSYRG00020 [Hibiscus syriacus]|uniref:Uncharacterized protein n=1 Tax=Hibiscus syriacus TaxID=106335 RepID=A0A6A2ZV81_HIBSY|nr:hypothetical protein F3Y22_tig00110678pilonHSYRG00020 [Hibiscus syriacus]
MAYIPTITNYTQLWWVPNVVGHQKEGIEAVHLASGRTVCKLHLQEGGLHADINGDGVLDHVQAVGGNGAEQTVVSGSMEVLRPCWAVATSGVPVREQLFNASICHHSPFNLFQHGEFYRGYGRTANVASLEVATPILSPKVTDIGIVTAYSPGLHGHGAEWQWQLLTDATWSNLPSPSGMMEGVEYTVLSRQDNPVPSSSAHWWVAFTCDGSNLCHPTLELNEGQTSCFIWPSVKRRIGFKMGVDHVTV